MDTKINAFLIRAYNPFAVSVGAKSHHMALAYVVKRFELQLLVHVSVASHAFFHLIARTCSTLVLIITCVPDLCVLRCLKRMNHFVRV